MTYVAGFAMLAAATAPAVLACRHLASRVVDETWARWALTIFVFCLQVVLSMQLLGAIGAWRPLPYLGVAWAGSALVWLIGRGVRSASGSAAATETAATAGTSDGQDTAAAQAGDVPAWLKFVAVAVPVFLVVAALVNLLFAPDVANDSTLYHRSTVAAWHRANTIWRIAALENSVYEGAFWSNGDIFGLWTVIPFARDYLLQACSLLWALGAYCAVVATGRSLRLSNWRAVVVASAVMCAWGVSYGQLSTFHVDLLTVLAGAVLVWAGFTWLRGDQRLRWVVLAALAAGLGAGTKQAAVPFVACCLLALVVVALARRRWRDAVLLVVLPAVPVLIWPLRNMVVTGNPLWPLALGPLQGATPGWTNLDVNRSVAGMAAVDPGQAVTGLVIALVLAYGPLLAGVVFGFPSLWRWARSERVWPLAVVAPVAGGIAYLVTPVTGFATFQIFVTMRFLAPQVATLTIALAAAVLPASVHHRRWYGLFGTAIVFGGAAVAVSQAYPSIFQWPLWAWPVAIAVAALAAWLVVSGRLTGVSSRALAAGATAAAVVLVVVAVPARAANWYPRHVGFEYAAAAANWFDANEPTGKNIAFVGVLSGWMVGRDLSNDLYYLGKPAANHGITTWDDQRAWEDALQAACTDYLVVSNNANSWARPLPEYDWARSSSILTPVDMDPAPGDGALDVRVYEVARDGRVDCNPPG